MRTKRVLRPKSKRLCLASNYWLLYLIAGPQSNTATNNYWRDKGAWIWGVVPSLCAWVALHLAFSIGYFVIAATLVMALLVDRQQFRHLISDEAYLADFLKMRTALTVVATASLIWAGIAIRQF